MSEFQQALFYICWVYFAKTNARSVEGKIIFVLMLKETIALIFRQGGRHQITKVFCCGLFGQA